MTYAICALGRYENWLQCWLWIVIAAFASMVTPKEHEQHAIPQQKSAVNLGDQCINSYKVSK